MLTLLLLALAAAPDKDLVDLGRKLFAAECAGCHNERGDKMLDPGYRLSEKKLDVADMRTNIASRLDSKNTERNRQAVEAYIRSFNRTFQEEAARAKKER